MAGSNSPHNRQQIPINPDTLSDAEPAEEVVVYYWGRIFSALAILALLAGSIAWGAMVLLGPDEPAPVSNAGQLSDELASVQRSNDGDQQDSPDRREPIFADELEGGDEPGAAQMSATNSITLPTTAAQPNDLPDEPTAAGPTVEINQEPEESLSDIGGDSAAAPLETASGTTTSPESAPAIDTGTASGSSPVRILSEHLTRAQLSSGLEDKEPIDQLSDTLAMEEDGLIRVFLFTEIQGMQDETHYHDWYLEDERVARVSITPFVDPMRASSAKFIDRHMLGEWRVEVVTAEGEPLAVGEFTVQ
ncbi:DUF2914 domain-containing protein [Marinobacter sp. chi1]|uniref:DUF2914 domain-containing protein n=1 Tax=Marinobacter suaedae TaxID=3057675 RepID=A0ABT8W1Q5_9GAMM|nr:DUF2914 domain-containing protein [Marinobacter sp. chi1]MDO3722179.1 DUF2914 domain-containing protein [Marinobacter sp. chi1]